MDKITLQLVRTSLAYASEEMGIALRNAAYSPNIKERMDHSAALFLPDGRLLAQAEHIPVHLGSLPWGLARLLEYCRGESMEFIDGSMVMANNPYLTGTHLNDVTVVAPVYHSGRIVAYAANKAHHSDVGGKTPGSISMTPKTLQEEGMVVDPVYLMRGGRFVSRTVTSFCSGSRTPKERLGDIRAQAAANVTGRRRVLELLDRYGARAFEDAAEESFRYSEALVRRRLGALKRGTYRATDFLEGKRGRDLRLSLSLTVSEGGLLLDYSGTCPQVDYPLNAVMGVTLSGAHFVVRTITGDDVPANHGTFLPIRVEAPPGTLLNPTFPHPVGAGNVETSQRNADLIYRALARAAPNLVPAASGGSMNNVMVGGRWRGRGWAFYETIGVGLGGRNGMDGIDGIQSNMTNTLNTPVEEVERHLPITVVRYEFREGSAGPGRYRGGCGLVRSYKALAGGTTFTIVADRERRRPWGLLGGGYGAPTRAFVTRKGSRRRLPSKGSVYLEPGDVVEILTAGGGGYGDVKLRSLPERRRDAESGLMRRGAAGR
jgi:N-methylhydantoinase B